MNVLLGLTLSLFHCRITKDEDGQYTVHYKSEDKESTVRVGLVMFGTGRKPNTRNIGLEVSICSFCLLFSNFSF